MPQIQMNGQYPRIGIFNLVMVLIPFTSGSALIDLDDTFMNIVIVESRLKTKRPACRQGVSLKEQRAL